MPDEVREIRLRSGETVRRMADEVREVTLRSGGTVMILLDTSVVTMTAADRAFLCEILDRVDAYEATAHDLPPRCP
jgi:hypothetical protein